MRLALGRRRRWALAVVLLPSAALAMPSAPTRRSSSAAAPAKAPKPPPPLSMLPSVARVSITTHREVLSVTEDVLLPRGEWNGEPLRFHVAFGAPGPRALDAHLVPVDDGELAPREDELGQVLPIERVSRRPADAHALLGRETMAGVVVSLSSDAIRVALSRGNMAVLRLRTLLDASGRDASGAASVVVRLGALRGIPLTLGRITVDAASPAKLARVEARLCGPDADPYPLAVGGQDRVSVADRARVIAPVLSVRHATDDLCVRLWHVPQEQP